VAGEDRRSGRGGDRQPRAVPPRSGTPRRRVPPPARANGARRRASDGPTRSLARSTVGRSRRRSAHSAGHRWGLIARWSVAMVSLLVFTVTGYGWTQYQDLLHGVGRSDAIRGDVSQSAGGDTNILIMGLDSRLDENGNPLPPEIYQALHAGDQQVGGYNANVLMLVHLPGDGSKATAISIPRDDYVSLPGSPDGIAKGKIKQAYGFAFDQEHKKLVSAGVTDQTSLEQRSRDAGRREEVDTVARFLGGVPIDHFVEVTMMAFYQLAQVVAPITVCLNEDTRDSYSGADFHRGYQQINAIQAVEFVRQRRDNVHPQLNFTDLDRERRQQAFIASLVYQLKQAGTLFNPARLRSLITVVKQNIAADTGLELLSFAQQASALAGGNITFTTLPIVGFGTDPAGEDVNIVNVPRIQSLVHNLIGAHTPTVAPPTSAIFPSPGSPMGTSAGRQMGTVDVINATNRNGLAAALERALTTAGFTPGVTSTAQRHLTTTTIYYPNPGSTEAANTLAGMLGELPTVQDSTVPTGHLRVVLGADFTMPDTLGTPTAGDSSPITSTPPAPAAPNHDDPGSTDPNSISGTGIPCVK
jgi:LCP family protein required for cell wall assembly